MNSLKKSLNVSKRIIPNSLKNLLNFQVKCNFSLFYQISNMNFARKLKTNNTIVKTINTILKNKSTLVNKDKSNNINTNSNIMFFGYSDQYNEDDSFHEIIHAKADPNQLKMEGLKDFLYSQNRDTPFEKVKKYLDQNYKSDDKKVMISLNNNNGVGKTHFLEIIRFREDMKDYLFFPRVKMNPKPAADALLEAMLESISICFGFDAIADSREDNIVNKEIAIKRICKLLGIILDKENIFEQLEIIEKKEKRVGNIEKALYKLLDNYFTLQENEERVIDLKLILDKVKGKNAAYFCFDEIGNVQNTGKKLKFNEIDDDNFRYYFKDLFKTHKRLIAMDEIRTQLNNIIDTRGLGVIAAGKNGLESFMGQQDPSLNAIKHINLPPLLIQYIKPIIKFELYRKFNCNLRKYLKDKYPKECNDKMKYELEAKMDQLIEKLYEYTAGHPRLLKYTIENLMERDELDTIDEALMNNIKPNQLPDDIFSRYNNKLLYLYFLNKVNNPILKPIMIELKDKHDQISIKGKELLYMFYLLNKGESRNLYLDNIKEAFELGGIMDLYGLFNSIGLSYIESSEDKKFFKVLIPKYISELLEKIEIRSFSFDYACKFMICKYGLKEEIFGEYISIFSYAEDTFFGDLKDVELQMIDGYSRSTNYLNRISQQIGSSQQSRIVMFKNVTNYAIDGLMLKHCDNKLIVHLIQVKSSGLDKAKISAQIHELENGITQTNMKSEIHQDLLKNFGLKSKNEIEITYVLISKEKIKLDRKDSFIGYQRIKYKKKKVSGKVLSLTDKTSESNYIKYKEKDVMMEREKNSK